MRGGEWERVGEEVRSDTSFEMKAIVPKASGSTAC